MPELSDKILDVVMLHELFEHDLDIYFDKKQEIENKWAGKVVEAAPADEPAEDGDSPADGDDGDFYEEAH